MSLTRSRNRRPESGRTKIRLRLTFHIGNRPSFFPCLYRRPSNRHGHLGITDSDDNSRRPTGGSLIRTIIGERLVSRTGFLSVSGLSSGRAPSESERPQAKRSTSKEGSVRDRGCSTPQFGTRSRYPTSRSRRRRTLHRSRVIEVAGRKTKEQVCHPF